MHIKSLKLCSKQLVALLLLMVVLLLLLSDSQYQAEMKRLRTLINICCILNQRGEGTRQLSYNRASVIKASNTVP